MKLKLGIPKGSLQDATVHLFARAGDAGARDRVYEAAGAFSYHLQTSIRRSRRDQKDSINPRPPHLRHQRVRLFRNQVRHEHAIYSCPL